MKEQLKAYIDTVFSDAEERAPGSERLAELKEEMLHNLYEKYDDLVAAGKSPAAAYHSSVASVGDISELLDSISGDGETVSPPAVDAPAPKGGKSAKGEEPHARPMTPEESAEWKTYKERSAVLSSVSVALYILCWVPNVVLDAIALPLFDEIGTALMFIMIAVATALQVYISKTKPKFGKDVKVSDGNDEDDDDRDEDDGDRDGDSDGKPEDEKKKKRSRRSPIYAAISGALWIVTVCLYLQVSFATGYWHVTWLIFPIATAVDHIIKAVFDLRR